MVEILSFNTFVCNNYFYVYLVLRRNLPTSLTTHLFSQQPTYSMRGDKMINKEQIKKLRDNAELAWAAYGYFNLVGKKFNDNDLKKTKIVRNPTITYADVLDLTYKDYETIDSTFFNTENLKGDFSPLQSKRFFEKYDLLKHCPNTESGFSATLFSEKRKQKDTESKAIKYTNKYGYINYILAIISTESKKVAQ